MLKVSFCVCVLRMALPFARGAGNSRTNDPRFSGRRDDVQYWYEPAIQNDITLEHRLWN